LAGEPLARTVPRDYPFSRYVYRLPRTTWRPIYGFLNRNDLNGVAFDLMLRGNTATLYVVPARVGQLPTSPPLRLGMATGGRAIVPWQENGMLYVLVVHGDERTYLSFIKRPALG
jgi:hypothetical protein